MSGKPYRLPAGAADGAMGRVIDRTQRLNFTFDGKSYSGHPGDTVGSALMANGVRLMGRSFKYHRPRSIVGAGADEPNALIGVGSGSRHEPNIRATQAELFGGLVASSQNNWPSLNFDVGALNGKLSRFFPAGFYYKTFMWPASAWMFYEHIIRRSAGLGKAPTQPDVDTYEHMHAACDVLVVGGGVAALAAAQAAASTGARVMLADESPRLGGSADISGGTIEGQPQLEWVGAVANALAKADNVHLLTRTVAAGHFHHNWCMLSERVTDHDPSLGDEGAPRHRLWRVRAKQIVLATGSLERPIAFANNDRPGVLLATAARTFAKRYGVSPGARGVVFTNNDDAYRTAIDLSRAGVSVPRLIDVRQNPEGPLVDAARDAGIDITSGAAVINVESTGGGRQITAVKVAPYQHGGRVGGGEERIDCDFVCTSGGHNPVAHLFCHVSGKVLFDDTLQTFKPGESREEIGVVGAANGTFDLSGCLSEGFDGGLSAARSALGTAAKNAKKQTPPKGVSEAQGAMEPVWFVPATGALNEGNKHFIDYQNDVTAADLELAVREGYRSVEHIKRYTTLGMATDQGKTSNINALGVLTDTLQSPIPQIGTTTFRPPYSPISIGAIAGSKTKELFQPVRRTPPFQWHVDAGADFEPVGQWRRPYCYPKTNGSRDEAIRREILATTTKCRTAGCLNPGQDRIERPGCRRIS